METMTAIDDSTEAVLRIQSSSAYEQPGSLAPQLKCMSEGSSKDATMHVYG